MRQPPALRRRMSVRRAMRCSLTSRKVATATLFPGVSIRRSTGSSLWKGGPSALLSCRTNSKTRRN